MKVDFAGGDLFGCCAVETEVADAEAVFVRRGGPKTRQVMGRAT